MNVEFEFQVRRALRSVLVPEGTPRPNPAAVDVQDLGPPGAQTPPASPAPAAGPRELTPASPTAPQGLVPGPGGTPGMGTLGTIPAPR
jgi:hypothetical protein